MKSNLSQSLQTRVELIYSLLQEVDSKTLEQWISGFEQDAFPAQEIYYFDILAHAFSFYITAHMNENVCKNTVFRCISSFMFGRAPEDIYKKYSDNFTIEDIEEMKIYFDCAGQAVHRHYR